MSDYIGTLAFVSSSIAFVCCCRSLCDIDHNIAESETNNASTQDQISNQKHPQQHEDIFQKEEVKSKEKVNVLHGREAMTALLSQATHPFSPLSNTDVFFDWAMKTIEEKTKSSKEFQTRQSLVELACKHEQEISQAESRVTAATLAWQAHPQYTQHSVLSQQCKDIRKVLLKMEGQLSSNISDVKLASLQLHISEKRKLLCSLEAQLDPLCAIPEYQAVQSATRRQEQLLLDLGITTTEKELDKIQHSTGVRKSKGGFRFEDEAARVIQQQLLPTSDCSSP